MNIYVGNLSRTTTEDGLKKMFEQYGEVQSVKIMKDKFTGEVRGFGFVTMNDDEAANAAINGANGQELDGYRLRVNEARPPEAREGGSMGGGSRGGFGGPRREGNGGGFPRREGNGGGFRSGNRF